jgi:hypothetical protein
MERIPSCRRIHMFRKGWSYSIDSEKNILRLMYIVWTMKTAKTISFISLNVLNMCLLGSRRCFNLFTLNEPQQGVLPLGGWGGGVFPIWNTNMYEPYIVRDLPSTGIGLMPQTFRYFSFFIDLGMINARNSLGFGRSRCVLFFNQFPVPS